jgi:thiamine biosynthesis protein ThiI
MNIIIVKFGDLFLKGKNIKVFTNLLYTHINNRISPFCATLKREHSWFTISVSDEDEQNVLNVLAKIPGIYSFYKVYSLPLDDEQCSREASLIIDAFSAGKKLKMKVETKRIDKTYPLKSLDYSRKISSLLLKRLANRLVVDVHEPDFVANFQINTSDIYFYISTNLKLGLGGFPYGVSGKALVMLSGGIDSPVSTYLSLKQGLDVELLHFESSPLTPLESTQKVIDIAKKLATYTPNGKIKLHIVPINILHQAILANVKDAYIITILRRMMYRLASRFLRSNKLDCIVNGESLGQVASQTINSINVISAVTEDVILRPLITYDKNDIIKIARQIDTFDISIRNFNDCCSIYVPKSPVINPNYFSANEEEEKFDFQELLNKVFNKIRTIIVKEDSKINICDYGFEFSEAFENYEKNNKQ